MSFRNIRPLHILWQDGIADEVINHVNSGIVGILSWAEVLGEILPMHFVQRRQKNWLENGLLAPYQSLDWHIELARSNSKLAGHLNSTSLLNSLRENPTCTTDPRYELVVVNEPLHWHDTSLRKVGGIGRQEQGAVITAHRDLSADRWSEKTQRKKELEFPLSIQMFVMHELGHVFGLFTKGTAKENPSDDELRQSHCLNECVMYWRDDHELNKKIERQPFCPSCLKQLRNYFLEPETIIIDVDDTL
ncbi:MAG: hypothetical protein G01um101413_776 [Parcubacteria group bacterium Gr01-1014_13]|nr:MAG: hypothetical protein G01um101413_776 [Parcubacteria group bacterium Gr01-1014_13]